MGTYTTQSRRLDSPSWRMQSKRWYGPEDSTPDEVYDDYWNVSSTAATLQQTTSYRSKSEKNRQPADLSMDEIREFADVTRNGLTEPNPRFDNGHEFFTAKRSLTTSHPNWEYRWQDRNAWSYWRKGPLFFTVPTSWELFYKGIGHPSCTLESQKLLSGDSNALGAKFIADTIPTKSPVSLAAILGEAYQGLPSLIGMTMLHGKGNSNVLSDVGGEYLNYAFGIAPTISDTTNLFKAIAEISKMIQQYHRDAGRVVRRKRGLPPQKTVEVTEEVIPPYSSNGPLWGWHDEAVASVGKINLTRKTTRRTWFSGAYSYTLGDHSDDVIGRFKQFEENANRALGTRLTLETLWQLAPWSWLLDWVANVDDVLTNATYLGKDGLVLRYGYLMNHVKVVDTYSMPLGATFKGGAKTGPITNVLTLESKERKRATPYGFGLTDSSFNAKQWAILGALGLTKAPSKLF